MITTELERLAAASGNISLEEKPVLPERLQSCSAAAAARNCGTEKIRTQAAAAVRSRGAETEELAAAKQTPVGAGERAFVQQFSGLKPRGALAGNSPIQRW